MKRFNIVSTPYILTSHENFMLEGSRFITELDAASDD